MDRRPHQQDGDLGCPRHGTWMDRCKVVADRGGDEPALRTAWRWWKRAPIRPGPSERTIASLASLLRRRNKATAVRTEEGGQQCLEHRTTCAPRRTGLIGQRLPRGERRALNLDGDMGRREDHFALSDPLGDAERRHRTQPHAGEDEAADVRRLGVKPEDDPAAVLRAQPHGKPRISTSMTPVTERWCMSWWLNCACANTWTRLRTKS